MSLSKKNYQFVFQNLGKLVRTAGFLYLIIIVCGISSEFLVKSSLFIPNSPLETLENILANPSLFIGGFILDVCMLIADIFLSILIYIFFSNINKELALTVLVFRLIQAIILASNLMSYISVLLLPSIYSTINIEAAQLGYFMLEKHSFGYDFGLIFFAISNLILGMIIINTKAFPRLIGGGLILAGITYLCGSFIRFTSSELYQSIQWIYIIPFIAELTFCLWLLTVNYKKISLPENRQIFVTTEMTIMVTRFVR